MPARTSAATPSSGAPAPSNVAPPSLMTRVDPGASTARPAVVSRCVVVMGSPLPYVRHPPLLALDDGIRARDPWSVRSRRHPCVFCRTPHLELCLGPLLLPYTLHSWVNASMPSMCSRRSVGDCCKLAHTGLRSTPHASNSRRRTSVCSGEGG